MIAGFLWVNDHFKKTNIERLKKDLMETDALQLNMDLKLIFAFNFTYSNTIYTCVFVSDVQGQM